MNDRRRFLHVLGAGAAALAFPACSSSIVDSPGRQVGGSSSSSGADDAGGAGAGGAGAGGGSASSSSGAGGPACQPTGQEIGMPSDFPTHGLRKLASDSLLVGRDAGGLYVLSSLCTHQFCDMAASQGGQQVGTITANGIVCNCHGSAFDASGNVTNGPAYQPLPAYALTLGCDGKLYVDQSTVVSSAARLAV